ncbi:nuclear transport factor 2 family protein [Streptomyces zingiberis]
MTTPAPVEELLRHGLRLLLDKDISGWVDLWDENGILEFPFAPDGWPKRLEGKAAVAAYLRGYPDHIDLQDFPEVTLHRTAEPGTAVIEMRAVGRLVKSGAPYDMRYITVMTAADGRFTHGRDYWNPLILLRDDAADFRGAAAR